MAIANDIIDRKANLASDRSSWEKEWRDVADFCLPTASRDMAMGASNGLGYDRLLNGPSTRDASRRRFDATAISALDRLAAGMESLVSPQAEKWHELGLLDPLGPDPSDEEGKWLERLRDYQFAVRYSPLSGFANVNQKFIRSICAFGTGVMFVQEAFGRHGVDQRQLPVIYQHVPLSQALIATDAQGNPDTVFRVFSMTARQMVQQFGSSKVSEKVRAAADDVKKQDTHYEIIHAVMPRKEIGSQAAGAARSAPFASYYVEADGAHLIGNSGFYEFPFAIGYWIQSGDAPYGESPAMAALDDIRGLNVTRKTGLRSMQQWVDPPLAVAHDGVMNRPNLNPRSINYGAIDANGRLKIQPIITSQNPSVVQNIIEDQRNQVRELLYNNLFQILVSNPQMTAHEAMLRAAEKGDLLGPNGVKIQQGYAMMADREIGIIERKGAFRPGASLEAPRSLAGRPYGARMTSPLDRLRSMKEATGILQTYAAAGQIASVRGTPDIFDNFDDDENITTIARLNGMPKRGMRGQEQRDADREARAQAMQQQMAMQQAAEMAKTAKDAMPAISEAASMAQQGDPNVAPVQLPGLPSLSGMPA